MSELLHSVLVPSRGYLYLNAMGGRYKGGTFRVLVPSRGYLYLNGLSLFVLAELEVVLVPSRGYLYLNAKMKKYNLSAIMSSRPLSGLSISQWDKFDWMMTDVGSRPLSGLSISQ